MGKHHSFTVSDTVTVKESVSGKLFPPGVTKGRRWIWHLIKGWFPSRSNDLYPEGVWKEQVVDRRENFYGKMVVDADIRVASDERVIKNQKERLSNHTSGGLN